MPLSSIKCIWRSSLPPPSSFLEADDCFPAAVRHDDGLTLKRQDGHLHGSGLTYAMRREAGSEASRRSFRKPLSWRPMTSKDERPSLGNGGFVAAGPWSA